MTSELRGPVLVMRAGIAALVLLTAAQIAVAVWPEDVPDPLVESWHVDITNDPIVPGKPIEMVGTFVCTEDAVEADPQVQFSSAISEEGVGGWTIARDLNPPFGIVRVCSGEPTEFVYAWTDPVERGVLGVADEEDRVEVRISVAPVEPGTWKGATVITPAVDFDRG